MLSTMMVSLNPYCSGRWSRTGKKHRLYVDSCGLNPYCSGRWSRTGVETDAIPPRRWVLILVVVDDGLVHMTIHYISYNKYEVS